MPEMRRSGTVIDNPTAPEDDLILEPEPDVRVIDVLQEMEGVGGADNTAAPAGAGPEIEPAHTPEEVQSALDRLDENSEGEAHQGAPPNAAASKPA